MHLANSETIRYRVTKLDDVITTSNSEHVNNNVVIVKQPQAIHYDRDIDGHVTITN